jgi:hypothetical protein
MLINDEAVKKIAAMATTLDVSASTHWEGHEARGREYELAKDPFDFSKALNNFDVIGPIGAISLKTSLPYKLMHWILQIPFRFIGARFKNFKQINRKASSIAECQDRAYDGDLMRHTLTMALINDRLDVNQDLNLVAVIGDGFANMSSILLSSNSHSRVILVNLTKTLLLDLAFLRKAFPHENIALAQNADEMEEAIASNNTRVIAVRADDMHILAQAPVTLGINIKSMMEMDPHVTEEYFDVLRKGSAKKTAFYCCNRDKKTWADGTVIRFSEYPWHAEDTILVDEPCAWDQFGYRKEIPFYYKRSGLNRHRLVYLKKHVG